MLVGVKYDECITDPRQTMTEIHSFCGNLCDTDPREQGGQSIDEFLTNVDTSMLRNKQQEYLEKKITTNEYYKALKSFGKKKTAGNDGLTVAFYLGLWHLIEKCLINALNFAHKHGQLSNSQKHAMITLLVKKDKDRRSIKNWRLISLIDVEGLSNTPG